MTTENPAPQRPAPPWTTRESKGRKRYGYFTRFDSSEISRCLAYLAPGDDDATRAQDIATLKRFCKWIALMGLPSLKFRALPGIILTLLGLVISLTPLLAEARGEMNLDPISLIIGFIFIVVGAFISTIGAAILTTRPSRIKFHRYVALTLKTQRRTYPGSPAHFLNRTGKASRELFRATQHLRLTWISPPLAADHALAVAYPLINVKLNPEHSLKETRALLISYSNFLYFASALEAAKRTDLIPKLRAYYADNEHLDYRSNPKLDSIAPERDALFLDPMRNHNRWAIAKDYLLPLASWLSFLVSAVALTVSIAK